MRHYFVKKDFINHFCLVNPHTVLKARCAALFLLLFWLPQSNSASLEPSFPELGPEHESHTPTIRETEESKRKKLWLVPVDMMENSRKALGSRLNAMSEGIDSFFMDSFFRDDDFEPESEENSMRISLGYNHESRQRPDLDLDLRAKINLPNTEKRTRLLFESDEDDNDVRSSAPSSTLDENAYRASLRFLLDVSKTWNTDLDAGVKFRLPLEPFVRLRLRRVKHFVNWDARLQQSFFWFNSKGFGETTRVEFLRSIGYHSIFTVNTSAEYLVDTDIIDGIHEYSLFHELGKQEAIGARLGVSFTTEENLHVDDYFLSARYRRSLYQDWLFWELEPQIRFPEEHDFKFTPSISLKLEMYVGDYL